MIRSVLSITMQHSGAGQPPTWVLAPLRQSWLPSAPFQAVRPMPALVADGPVLEVRDPLDAFHKVSRMEDGAVFDSPQEAALFLRDCLMRWTGVSMDEMPAAPVMGEIRTSHEERIARKAAVMDEAVEMVLQSLSDADMPELARAATSLGKCLRNGREAFGQVKTSEWGVFPGGSTASEWGAFPGESTAVARLDAAWRKRAGLDGKPEEAQPLVAVARLGDAITFYSLPAAVAGMSREEIFQAVLDAAFLDEFGDVDREEFAEQIDYLCEDLELMAVFPGNVSPDAIIDFRLPSGAGLAHDDLDTDPEGEITP